MMLLLIQMADAKPFIAISVLVLLLAWETMHPFFDFAEGGKRLGHGVKNFVLGVSNGAMTALLFVGVWLLAANWAEQNQIGLLNWFSPPAVVASVGAVLMLDAWTYAWHRMNHRIPFLWRFHRMHHSDSHMDVTTANRFHIGEIIISSVLRIPLIVLLGLKLEHIAVYELLMFSVVQFHHANISISAKWDRWLRVLIVTPFMHKVHHSRWQLETDSNYSSFLSIWDRIFRSFRINEKPESIILGLDDFNDGSHQTLIGLLKTPVAKTRRPNQK
ncbi:sterol desaturase family protein [Luteolibacter algae]|uniref:Sterol desaturase family protein n=1 Tax=Luteolibacter algae TaxID=454151 RepID=A0ABW5D3M5_9BACT